MIVTFYSYKGGTGRTMALANVGYLLARQREGRRVLLLDWDLEAPGLHRYFHRLMTGFVSQESAAELDSRPGIIDFFCDIAEAVKHVPPDAREESTTALLRSLPLTPFLLQTDVPGLWLFKSGRFDQEYPRKVCEFRWQELYTRSPSLYRVFGERLAEEFDFVLIDSRTGITDTSGICTSILPDKLVVVFTPNRQSLLGAMDVIRSATQYRKDSDDLRPLVVFPLVSRVEANEPQLRTLWRTGSATDSIPGYQPLFEDLFRSVYHLPDCNLEPYFTEAQIQHVPWFAYGEEIAAHVETSDRLSLTRSFEHFVRYLTETDVPWQVPGHLENVVGRNATLPVIDETWLASNRARAEQGLASVNASGLMEASAFVNAPGGPINQKQLFDAAQASQVPGTGWPIGAVVTVDGPSRPRTTEEGLVAEIVDERALSCDYWALRNDGSFYFLRNLEEDPDILLVDDRVDRVTELLVHCQRLYSFLRMEQGSHARLSIRFSGLQGRSLATRVPERSDAVMQMARTCHTDTVQSETTVPIEALQRDIAILVRDLTRPLFWAFDFYELADAQYNIMVANRLRDWGISVAQRNTQTARTPA